MAAEILIVVVVVLCLTAMRSVASAGLELGISHSCGFWTSSEVKCWGRNDYGQLGDGTTKNKTVPVVVSSVTGVSAISAGGYHTCAMLSVGTVQCWGRNSNGQLGDGTTTQRLNAVSVSSVSGVTAIAAGGYHTCALLSGSTVKCWGSNGYGQLGDGTTTQRSTAVSVTSVSSVSAITAGDGHTCALLSSDGSVRCWGANTNGQLGDGTTTSSSTAVTVSSVSGATAIAAGGHFACALISAGAVKCWGNNFYGQLGDGTDTHRSTAVSVSSLTGATAISLGNWHMCVVTSTGTVKCWGLGSYGEFGDGTRSTSRMTVPSASVTSVSSVTVLASGEYHSCAILSDIVIRCWGDNTYGQLGDGSVSLRSTSVIVRSFNLYPTSQPTRQPTCQPSSQPTMQPSIPTSFPTSQPSRPTNHPSSQPSRQPSRQPSSQPSRQPSGQPTRQPSSQPSRQPSRQPSSQPTTQPSARPSSMPSTQPSAQPSQPSSAPSQQPSGQPTLQPQQLPTAQPSAQPSRHPSSTPSMSPSAQPSSSPSTQPSRQPSHQPTRQPSSIPTGQPSSRPSARPSSQPTRQPTSPPSQRPTCQPSAQPSVRPSSQPSSYPSQPPSTQPSSRPSSMPSQQPTGQPTLLPSLIPTSRPSSTPSTQPSLKPSQPPSTQPSSRPSLTPSVQPSSQPSHQPSPIPSAMPSIQPSGQPTQRPSPTPTSQPSSCPSSKPASQPSAIPSLSPSAQPTLQPSSSPSQRPSGQPSLVPSSVPSSQPSSMPSHPPSGQPTVQPSQLPTWQPSSLPSSRPSSMPSDQPSSIPSAAPSTYPSAEPSSQPSSSPSLSPTGQPMGTPTGLPTTRPNTRPTQQPSSQPSTQPTSQPSMRPTALPTTPPTGPPSLSPSSQPTCRPSEQPSSQSSSPPSNQPTAQPTRQPSSAPTLRLVAATAQPTVSSVPSMAPTARPSISPGLAVNTATQDALRSLLANGTASSGTVTSVTADGLKLALAVVRPSNATHNGTTASYAVALPDSSTRVALALPSSLTGGAVAVVVTTVEVEASRLSSFGSSGGNSSSNSSVSILPSPQLVSSVVTIQVSQLSGNGSLTTTTVPYFETSVSVTRANSTSTAKPTILAHNCTVGVVETVSVYCADTLIWLNLTCSGRAAATVRRQCPVSQAMCTVVDLSENRIVSSTFCRTVDLGSSVVCQCGGSGSGVNGSAIASAGRVSVGVFQVYGAGSLTSSVALANALSASDVASRSVMIFASFGCLWGVGLLLLVVSWRHWADKRHRSEASTCVQTEAVSSLWVRLVLPGYYQASSVQVDGSEGSWRTSFRRRRWVQVLVASHPYLRVLRTLGRWSRGDGSDRTATPVGGSDRTGTLVGGSDRTVALVDDDHAVMMDVVQALTALTLACGMLALLYDFQYPEDDGFCAAQTTQATCESRKMLLDPFQSQCLWRPPPGSEGSSGSSAIDEAAAVLRQIASGRVVDTVPITSTEADETPSCRFNGSNDSELAFVVSYVITALFAGVLGLMLDRCQEVLKAKETTVTLRDRRRVRRIADSDTESVAAPAVKADAKQLALRAYPEAAVHSQRDRHRYSSISERSKPSHGRSRHRHAVIDVRMVDGDPVEVRPAARSSTGTMDRDPEAAITEDHHETMAVSATAQVVTQAKRSMSSTDYAVTMLRLAVADEVGRLGGPAERHVCLLGLYRAFPAVVSLRRVWLWQCAVVGLLVVCNGGALYYIVSKAAVRGYGWQVSFLQIALFEWFSEVVLLRSVEIALFDYGLCWLVGDEVEAAVRQLEAVAAEVTAGSSMVVEDGGVVVEEDAASVSQEMARQWSGLPESRWVVGLRAGRSVSHGTVAAAESRIGDSDGRSDRRRRWWTRLLSRGSLETWEMAVSFGSPLVLAWLVFMYYRFVDGWLTSLSALGQGLAAMTVVLSVVIGVAVVVYRRRKSSRSIAHVEARTQVAVDGVIGVVSIKAATDEPIAHVVDGVVEAGDVGDDDESLSRSPPMDDSSAGSAAGQLTGSDFSSFSLSSDEPNADDQDDADGSEGGSCSDSDRGDDSDESTHSYRIFSL